MKPLRDPSNTSELMSESVSRPEHKAELQEAERPAGSSDEQLLGVLAEALFDRDKALRAFNELKAGSLYDSEHRQWNSSGGRGRATRTQLLGILAEALFNRDAAQASLAALKASPFYDREHDRWYAAITDQQVVENAAHTPDDQLLAVLAEALFDREAARKGLMSLKASPLYDSEHRRWNNAREGTQLLGVLAESLFDRNEAAATLAVLRTTEPASRSAASKDYADALVLNAVGGKLFGKEQAS